MESTAPASAKIKSLRNKVSRLERRSRLLLAGLIAAVLGLIVMAGLTVSFRGTVAARLADMEARLAGLPGLEMKLEALDVTGGQVAVRADDFVVVPGGDATRVDFKGPGKSRIRFTLDEKQQGMVGFQDGDPDLPGFFLMWNEEIGSFLMLHDKTGDESELITSP